MEGMEGMEGMEAVAHNPPALKTRRGFNLIEAAIVLGVVGAVLGTIWGVSAHFYEEYKVNKTVEGVFTIIRNTQSIISGMDSEVIGSGVSLNHLLISAKAVPEDWLGGKYDITHPFGGHIRVINYVANPRFDVAIRFIDNAVCIKLATRLTAAAKMAGSGNGQTTPFIWYMNINSSGTFNTSFFPVSVETATTYCNFGKGSNYVLVDATYTRTN